MKKLLFLFFLGVFFLSPFASNAQTVRQVSQNQGFKQTTAIKASPGKLNVVYDNTLEGLQDIFYQQSIDGGVSYLPAVKVSQTNTLNFSPDVAVSPSGIIYVVWSGLFNQGRVIFLSRSTNNGLSFSSPQVVSIPDQIAQVPKININQSGRVFITYFAANNVDNTGGAYITTLSETGFPLNTRPRNISRLGEAAIATNILFDSQQNTYIVYGDSNTGITYLVTGDSIGRSFTGPLPIATGSPSFSTDTSAFIDSQDNIYVSANSGPIGGFSIYFTKSSNRGRTFTTPQIIPNSFNGIGSTISAINNNVTVSWTDFNGSLKIVSAKSTDGGVSFGAKTIVSTNTLNGSFNVDLTSIRGINFFSWVSEIGVPGSNTQIFSVGLP
ncbi:MAG: hypothetical protein HY819_04215 [Acidobacteria bacterium]|nr:hypothetical protein [Acidobacteriota bacterium]